MTQHNTRHSSFAPGRWFASECTFDKATWSKLHNKKFTIVKGAPQDDVLFPSEVMALVWGDDDEEEQANARLMAAAPEMLKVLVEAEKLIAKNTYPQPDKPNSQWALLERIRDAIEKATAP